MNTRNLKRKVKEIDKVLEDIFGIPDFRRDADPLDTLVETILSQNTNDTNRDRAYTNLREMFPTWEDVLAADAEDIADAIRVGGLGNQKSVRIKNVLAWIKDTYGKLNIDFVCLKA